MSRRERLRVSFNLDSSRHMQAWEQIGQLDGKQRSDYIIDCILAMTDDNRMEKTMRKVLDERFEQVPLQPAMEPTEQAASDADRLPDALIGLIDVL